MTASSQVAAICARIGPGIHPHESVDEADWVQWLAGFDGIPPRLGDCPRCGMELVRRTARATGREFIGCSGWKKNGKGCGYTRAS